MGALADEKFDVIILPNRSPESLSVPMDAIYDILSSSGSIIYATEDHGVLLPSAHNLTILSTDSKDCKSQIHLAHHKNEVAAEKQITANTPILLVHGTETQPFDLALQEALSKYYLREVKLIAIDRISPEVIPSKSVLVSTGEIQ